MGIDGVDITRTAADEWAEGAGVDPEPALDGLIEWIAEAVLQASAGKSSVMSPTQSWDWT